MDSGRGKYILPLVKNPAKVITEKLNSLFLFVSGVTAKKRDNVRSETQRITGQKSEEVSDLTLVILQSFFPETTNDESFR
jgi:hypothetical protein